MAKALRQAKNKNKTKNTKKSRQMVSKNAAQVAARGGARQVYIEKMLALYADPCNGDLTHPPYAGTDAGYLARTVDIFRPSYTSTTTGSTIGSFYLSWSPWNYGTGSGYVIAGVDGSVTMTTTDTNGPGNFIMGSSVKTYRPVAACLEWVPTDPVLSRAGSVSLGYSPSVPIPSSISINVGAIEPLALKTSTNGFDSKYGINWLPSMNDERFTTSAGSVAGVGTVFAMLDNVGLARPSVAGTQAYISGYFRVTTVWEWIPQQGNGLVVDPRTPVPYTINDVLSRAGDIKRLLFAGMEMGGNLLRIMGGQSMRSRSLLT